MNIEEIKQAKQAAEARIAGELANLVMKTGMRVEAVQTEESGVFVGGVPVPSCFGVAVSIDLRLR